MRSAPILVVFASLVGCGGAQEPSPPPVVVAIPTASAAPPPAPPPLPPEPAGLTVVGAPPKVCEIRGTFHGPGFELATAPRTAAFGLVSGADVTVDLGNGAAFAQVRTPSWTLRGLASASWRVHAARWLAFGGVLHAGARDQLEVRSAHDGKVVLSAPDVSGLSLAEGARTIEASCDDVSFDSDPAGALRRDLPAAFEPAQAGKEQHLVLRSKKPVPVSAEPKGPPGATIDTGAGGVRVTVLERSGTRARIRWDHVAGWVDAALLAPRPLTPREKAIQDAVQFGMIGLIGGGSVADLVGGAPAQRASPPQPPSPLVCAADVRLVVDAGSERFVVGTIPAGKPVRVVDRGPELSAVLVGGAFEARSQAHLAVPSRDIAVGCTPASEAASAADPVPDVTSFSDAIDRLDGSDFGIVAPASGIGIGTFGAGGLGGLGGAPRPAGSRSVPSIREGAVQVTGRLPPEVVQRIVRQNFGRFRLCYERGLKANPSLAGRVSVRFVIDATGAVASASDAGSTLPSPDTVGCVVRSFGQLSFPQPESGAVTVVYPMELAPRPPSSSP